MTDHPLSSWIRARGQLAFLVGLLLASAVILRIERAQYVPIADVVPVPAFLRPSTPEAGAQWAYVERNTDPATSLVSATEGASVTSLAGIGHAIKATLAAHRLNFVNGQELFRRVTALIEAGARIPVVDAGMSISTRTGRPTTEPADESLAPYRAALELVSWSYPALRGIAVKELARWSDAELTTPEPGVNPTSRGSVTPLRTASDILQRAATIPEDDRQ